MHAGLNNSSHLKHILKYSRTVKYIYSESVKISQLKRSQYKPSVKPYTNYFAWMEHAKV